MKRPTIRLAICLLLVGCSGAPLDFAPQFENRPTDAGVDVVKLSLTSPEASASIDAGFTGNNDAGDDGVSGEAASSSDVNTFDAAKPNSPKCCRLTFDNSLQACSYVWGCCTGYQINCDGGFCTGFCSGQHVYACQSSLCAVGDTCQILGDVSPTINRAQGVVEDCP